MSRLVVALLLATGVAVSAQTGRGRLTDAEVNLAIQAGQGKRLPSDLVSSCIATLGLGSTLNAPTTGGVSPIGHFEVTVMTEKGRIAMLAADAKRLYKPFSIANVTAQMRVPAVYVAATAQKPEVTGSLLVVAAPAEAMVLKSKVNPSIVLRPTKFTAEPVEWTNMIGGKFHGANGLGVFSPEAVKNLPAGDFDVVVIAAGGERKCKVGVKDRKALFGN